MLTNTGTIAVGGTFQSGLKSSIFNFQNTVINDKKLLKNSWTNNCTLVSYSNDWFIYEIEQIDAR